MGATIREIARLCNVSKITVSRVLHNERYVKEETRQKVLGMIRELRYNPADNPPYAKKAHNKTLGLVIPFAHTTGNRFLNQAIGAIKDHTRHLGYGCLLFTEDELQDKLKNGGTVSSTLFGCDGLVVFCPYGRWDSYLKILKEWGVPCVLVRRTTKVKGVPVVTNDDYHGAWKVMEHLYQLGHRRIGYVTRRKELEDGRMKGYGDFASRHHLGGASGVYEFPESEPGLFNQRLDTLLRGPHPTAFFCYDDTIAIQLVTGLEQLGKKVPEDLAVVGFDNLDEAAFFKPPLTTVNLPVEQMCGLACKILADYIKGIKLGKLEVVLDNDLIIRESCGYRLKTENRHPKTETRKRGKLKPDSASAVRPRGYSPPGPPYEGIAEGGI